MPIVRRRVVAGAVVLAIALVAVWWWRREGSTSREPMATTTLPKPSVAPAAGDAPRWFGQPGVTGRRIAGTVLGESGAPIAGASVRLASLATTAGLRVEPVVQTDAAGRFDFGGRAAAEYVVVAETPHLTAAIDRVDLRDPTVVPPPDELRLVLHACDASIHGTIRDTAGGVIAGARIARDQVTSSGGVESDRDGRYELCVPAGGAQVVVSGDGYAVVRDTVSVYGKTRHDFELAPGATVSGRVVRGDDKSPVAGAIVELHPESWQSSGSIVYASSDAAGAFHIEGVTPGRHLLSARADRLATETPIGVIAEIGATEEVSCELTATFSVSGKVVTRDGEAPVAGATVYLSIAAMGRAARSLSAVTQSDGSFMLDRVLPGEYRPFAMPYTRPRAGGEPPKHITVQNADVTGIVITVDRGASITGRILHAGKPVDGATVTIEGESASVETDHDGSYTVRGLAAGSHVVYAQSHRAGAFARSAPVVVAKDEERKGVDVELALSGSIAGVVVDDNDAPVPGVFLGFSLLHGRDFGSATTADDGTFIARALSGGGDYVFEVRPRDQSPLVFPPVTGKRHPPVTVADGATHVTGVRVKIHVERLAISGRVTDALNQPVADVVVRAMPDDSARSWGPAASTTSDQAGAFTIRDLSAGAYRLQASGARGEVDVENIAAGQTNVALRLVELGGIDGILDGVKATSVVATRLDAARGPARATLSGNGFTLRNLTAGTYRVVASSPAGNEAVQVTVSPGAIAKVTLKVREVGSVEGVAVSEKTRAPVPGVRCMSRREGDEFGGPSLMPVVTDARGAFRIERAATGSNRVMCGGSGGFGSDSVVVAAGQVARVEVVIANAPTGDEKRANAGIELEEQLGEVLVESVTAGGPAARAGIKRGDVLVKINDVAVKRMGRYGALSMLTASPGDKPLTIVLERDDKPLTVLLTLER